MNAPAPAPVNRPDQPLGPNAQLALDAIHRRPTRGIPIACCHIMERSVLERLAGTGPGSYVRDPTAVYLAAQRRCGACDIDQWIPDNPLTMGDAGYEGGHARTASAGAEVIVVDGRRIETPEDAAAHLQEVHIPQVRQRIAAFDEAAEVARLIGAEARVQRLFGEDLLKIPYYSNFPHLRYGCYGYQNYFMAYALYPEVCEQAFAVEGDLAALKNRALARAITEAGLPPLLRLDHDMADSRGMLVRIGTLDKLWFPHFVRSIAPLLAASINLIWHCDGNLMDMVPRLLDVGLQGFQGFQYEDGMDYRRICAMRTKDGREPLIWAGVSVTRTLPMGTPDDVRREIRFLVENGPRTGLWLGPSSSVTPGVAWENIQAMLEGFAHYHQHSRG